MFVEDPFLYVSFYSGFDLYCAKYASILSTGEMGYAFVKGLQSGRRRNASTTANYRMAATCKHFAAFGTPQGGL